MISALRWALSVAAGAFGGWWTVVGVCSIEGIKFSVLCGHNAPLLIVPFGWLIGFLCWRASSSLARIADRASPRET
jgi:hypothetical protein